MRLIYYLFAIKLLSTPISLIADNKIVYLIAPPRSLSTVFLHMMSMRPDFEVLNEPSQHFYIKKHRPETAAFIFKDNLPNSEDELKNLIMQKSLKKHLFIKDVSWYMENSIATDLDFVKNKNVYFIFLIRNPHHTIISLYNRLSALKAQNHNYFQNTIGFHSLFNVYQYVKNNAYNKPCIIEAEDLYTKKNYTLAELCLFLGIDNDLSMHHWQAVKEQNLAAVSDKWNDPKNTIHNFMNWHGKALTSTGLHTPTSYKTNSDGNPTFEEIADSNKSICLKAYEANFTYYQQLLKEPYLLKNYRSDLHCFVPPLH